MNIHTLTVRQYCYLLRAWLFAPKQHVLARNILVVLFLVFSVQFIATVYAMAFTLVSSTTEENPTFRILMGDFDNDGDLDWISMNVSSGSPPVIHDLYLNNGSAVFTPSTFSSSANTVNDVAVADINNDGNLDIILMDSDGSHRIRVYTNNGSASFTSRTYSPSGNAQRVAAMDVDNDGDVDIVVGYTAGAITNAVWINDGHGNLTEAASTLPSTDGISTADFNSDGYLDLALNRPSANAVVYLNSGTGAFILSATLSNDGHTAMGDVDGDGDVDIVTADAGVGTATPYLNNDAGTSFTAGTAFGDVSLANRVLLSDLDNDGDLDAIIAATDTSGSNGGNEVWINNGSATFTQSGTPTEEADRTPDAAIGDMDADGDLDYIAGNIGAAGAGAPNRYYASDQAATSANTAPTAPTSLAATVVSAGATADVRLTWGSGSDTQTATRLLQYQLRVGTGSNAHNILSGRTSSPNWMTRMVPNGQSRTMLLENLTCGLTYYWTVSTIDTGYKVTAATEQSFTLNSSCTLASGSSSSGGGGGGRFLPPPPPPPPAAFTGTITVSAFHDVSGDGIRQDNERQGFKGLPFTASGRTLEGKAVKETRLLPESGETTFTLDLPDERGYFISYDTGSLVLKEFIPTLTFTGGLLLKKDEHLSLAFGFKREDLIRYLPALTIGDPPNPERPGPDPVILLQRLYDPFGIPVLKGITLKDGLLSRRDFLFLLQRTQNRDLIIDQNILAEKLRTQAKLKNKKMSLLDLPLLPLTHEALVTYSLLAEGIDAARDTKIGPAADLLSPVTRAEAIHMIVQAMEIPPSQMTHTGGTLPPDLQGSGTLVSAFLTLQKLGVLPDTFQTFFSEHRGIDLSEASTLLTRASFRAGRIRLLPDSTGNDDDDGEDIPTFLSLIPDLTLPLCLEKDPDRHKLIGFTDLLPGDLLHGDLDALLQRFTENSDKKTLWLIPGTLRPTEFGVLRGRGKFLSKEPASILETIRALLVLSCLPPETASDVIKGGGKKSGQGSGESRVPRDRISDLPRDPTFASRVLYRSQDHQQEFDLSLFTYADHLLSKPTRSPGEPFTVEEAADLLASGLLGIMVRAQDLTPQEAENQSGLLSDAITTDLFGDIDWRNEGALRTVPFTKEMLLKVLATAVLHRLSVSSNPSPPLIPLGEVWWERVR